MEEEVKVVANRVMTPDGTILWSRYTHDYVQYHDKVSDEDYMLDGGTEYRRTFVNKVPAKNMTITSQDPWGVQREFRLRGTFDKAGCRVWVPLSKLSNGHIKALVDMMCNTNSIYHQELEYRKERNIDIADHDYANEGAEAITHTRE